MLKRKLNRLGAVTGAAFTMGMMTSGKAYAGGAAAAAAGTPTFNTIATNITTSIASLPGFLTAVSYMMGLLFAVLGILKIKDHVENPSQTQLKDGAIRLAVGGGLFTLPIITQAMQELVDAGNMTALDASKLNKVKLEVNP
jgi:hypothetical protein